jgi:hypothetical protein
MLSDHKLLPPPVAGDARIHEIRHLWHQTQWRDVPKVTRNIQGCLQNIAAQPDSIGVGSDYIPEARTIYQSSHVN